MPEARLVHQRLPVLPCRTAQYGQRSIVFHKVRPGKKTGEQPDGVEGHPIAVQVVHKKAFPGVLPQPLKQLQQFAIAQVMTEKRAEYNVGALGKGNLPVIGMDERRSRSEERRVGKECRYRWEQK